MKKIVLAPDAFKGTMSSIEICQLMEAAIQSHFPQTEVVSIPIADGGEGTVDCFLMAVGGRKIEVTVKDPYFQDIPCFYGLIHGGQTAVIEVAACIGLPLVDSNKNPAITTSFGVGQMISNAVLRGCSQIIIGLGGSCTNDAGCGCLAALGVKFLDNYNTTFIPTGNTLKLIRKMDLSGLLPELENCSVRIMCDINNPLYGKQGAAHVYAPQKGADPDMVIELDDNLRHFSVVLEKTLKRDIHSLSGAGAAGGMGAGLLVLPESTLSSGIDTILETIGFQNILEGADLVLTGEGRFDQQSLNGKVVMGIAKLAHKFDVPVIAIVGDIGEGIEEAYEMGLNGIISINRKAIPFEQAKKSCKSDLALTLDNLFRMVKTFN